MFDAIKAWFLNLTPEAQGYISQQAINMIPNHVPNYKHGHRVQFLSVLNDQEASSRWETLGMCLSILSILDYVTYGLDDFEQFCKGRDRRVEMQEKFQKEPESEQFSKYLFEGYSHARKTWVLVREHINVEELHRIFDI